MRIPVIRGIIDRRILINYRVDPVAIRHALPPVFEPMLVDGHAIAGICLIRLKQLHPRWIPFGCGFTSENAAHRIAVKWKQGGGWKQGVYIPRRDTDSYINSIVGGRLFPGVHQHASFDVQETDEVFRVGFVSHDDHAFVNVEAKLTDRLNSNSVFVSLDEASRFFEQGSLGFSPATSKNSLEGLELQCKDWSVQPLRVIEARSSFFGDESIFPQGSLELDCALLMRNIAHQWQARSSLCCDGIDASRLGPWAIKPKRYAHGTELARRISI